MTPSLVSRLALVVVLAVALPAAAQSPPTAGFPIDTAPSAQTPAPAPSPSVPPSSAAPPASAPAPAPPSATPPPIPAPAPPASAPPPLLPLPPPASRAPAPAPAEPAPDMGGLEGVPPPEDGAMLAPPPLIPEISFERSPGWGVELDARGGLGVLAGSDARGAFVFGGGLLRGHYGYFEVGAFYDHADSEQNGGTFSHAGGFAGAWLPYHNWVDFELAAGLGVRRYSDPDPRYGANGYALNAPALSFIFGVSDRAQSGNFGGRVGGELVFSEDLKQKNEPWLLQEMSDAGEVVNTTGITHAGGFSASLVLVIGLDYGSAP